MIEPQNTRALQGSAAVIDCMVKGYPTPQITWKRMIKSPLSGAEGTEFTGGDRLDSSLIPTSSPSSSDQVSVSGKQYHLIRSGPDYQVYENGSLRITTSYSGDLLCTASNGVGPGISKVVRLTVNGEQALFNFFLVCITKRF